jgi:hypothetical protein
MNENIYKEAVNDYVQRTKKSKDAYKKARKVITGGETRSNKIFVETI